MGRFKDLILTELGETTDTYNYRLDFERDGKLIWKFKTESNTYKVTIAVDVRDNDWLIIGFTAVGDTGLTNEGKQFEVSATVMEIARETWERREEFFSGEQVGFEYIPIPKDDEPDSKDTTARDKLYRTFIDTQFPDAKVYSTSTKRIRIVPN